MDTSEQPTDPSRLKEYERAARGKDWNERLRAVSCQHCGGMKVAFRGAKLCERCDTP